jgi:hypothetical protein
VLDNELDAQQKLAILLKIHSGCGVFLNYFAENRSHIGLKSSVLAELVVDQRPFFNDFA